MSPDGRDAEDEAVTSDLHIIAFVAVNVVAGAAVTATTAAAGVSPLKAAVLTITMLAGAAQLAVVAVMLASGPVWAMFMAALLVNARFLMLGASTAPLVRMSSGARAVAAWMLIDPVVLMVRSEPGPRLATRTFWRAGIPLVVSWSVGAVIGAVGLTLVDDLDLERFGFDVALPALLLGLLANNLRDRSNLAAAGAGGAITFGLLFVVPAGAAVLLGSLGAAAPLLYQTHRRRTADR